MKHGPYFDTARLVNQLTSLAESGSAISEYSDQIEYNFNKG